MKIIIAIFFLCSLSALQAQNTITYTAAVDSLGRYTFGATVETKTEKGGQVIYFQDMTPDKERAVEYLLALKKKQQADLDKTSAWLKQLLDPAETKPAPQPETKH